MKNVNSFSVTENWEKQFQKVSELVRVICLSTSLLLPIASFWQTQRVVTPTKYSLDWSLIDWNREWNTTDVILKTWILTQSEEQARKRVTLHSLYIQVLESKGPWIQDLNLELYETYLSFMRINFNTNLVQTESFKNIENYLKWVGFKIDRLQF